MEYAELGDTGLRVSRIAFGCWAIGASGWGVVDDHDSINAIRHALQGGITLFDTADVYGLGHSEEVLGKALGPDRKKALIATKGGVRWTSEGRTCRDSSPAWIAKAIDDSLRRLSTDHIDLYQIHWPDPQTPIDDTLQVVEAARAAGKVGHIGCSNFPYEAFEVARRRSPIASNQLPFNLINRSIETTFLSRSQGPVLAYGPLAQGLLTGKYGSRISFPASDVRSRTGYFDSARIDDHLKVARRVARLADCLGRRPAQVALRWVLDVPGIVCAIAGAKTITQVDENIGIDFSLPREDHEALASCSDDLTEERRAVRTSDDQAPL